MKTRKFLLLVCSLVFALTAPVNAASLSIKQMNGGVYYPDRLSFTVNAGSLPVQTTAPDVYLSNYASGSYNYYNQLNTMEKTVYNGLKQMSPTGGVFYIQFAYTDGTPTDSSVEVILSSALDAYLFDYPELFWLDLSKMKIEIYADSTYNPTITLQIEPAVESGFSVSDSALESTLQSAENSIPVNGSSRYEKLKSIHDALANKVSYDYTAVSYYNENGKITGSIRQSFSAYGALVNGKAVCEGYAEAFKLLCDRANIPCIVVVGMAGLSESDMGSHMWNAVKMEDGNWYNVDVTWDDQLSIRHDFFLVGSDSVASAFTTWTYAKSHQANGKFSLYNYDKKIFTYPAISKTAYNADNTVTTTTEPEKENITIPKPIESTTATTITNPPIAYTDPPAEATATAKKTSGKTNPAVQNSSSQETTTETLSEESTDTLATDTSWTDSMETQADTSSETIAEAADTGNASPVGTALLIGGVILIVAAAGVIAVLLLKRNSIKMP